MQETRIGPWVRKILWRREWHPTLVFLPGESHGQRSLAGYSPQGCKESDVTEHSEDGEYGVKWGENSVDGPLKELFPSWGSSWKEKEKPRKTQSLCF